VTTPWTPSRRPPCTATQAAPAGRRRPGPAAAGAGAARPADGGGRAAGSSAPGRPHLVVVRSENGADPNAADIAVQAAVERFGRVDVLVNNAGNFNAGFFEELSPEDFRAQIETTSSARSTSPVLPFRSCEPSAPSRATETREQWLGRAIEMMRPSSRQRAPPSPRTWRSPAGAGERLPRPVGLTCTGGCIAMR